jgi:hypothetical protein
MGEAKRKALVRQRETIALDTFGGRIHAEWDLAATVTPLGQLPFFIEFLKVSGLFEVWVTDCPLAYQSNNASDKRAVLASFLLSILRGITVTRISRRFVMTAYTLSCWGWRNWSRRCSATRTGAHQ